MMLSTFSYAYLPFFWVKCSFSSFARVVIGSSALVLFSLKVFVCALQITILHHVCGLSFHPLHSVFVEQMFVMLVKSNLANGFLSYSMHLMFI